MYFMVFYFNGGGLALRTLTKLHYVWPG